MSDHNLTRVSGTETQTVITESERCRLVAVMPEQTMAGTLTIYEDIGDAEAATGTATAQDGGTGGDSITIGGITITLVDPGPPADENEIDIEATAADLTDALLAALQAHSGYADEDWTVAKTAATILTVTAKVAGQAGNSIALTEVGTSWVNSDVTLLGGTNFSGGTAKHICAAALGQSGKEFSAQGVRLMRGLAVERSNAADEVGIVWAPGHTSV